MLRPNSAHFFFRRELATHCGTLGIVNGFAFIRSQLNGRILTGTGQPQDRARYIVLLLWGQLASSFDRLFK